MFLLGVASVTISMVALTFQHSIAKFQRENGQQDIALKQKNGEFQKEVEGDRLAAMMVPFLNCRDSLQRAVALQLVSGQHSKLFTDAISQKCTLTPQARSEITQIRAQSVLRQRTDAFFTKLANAREYKNQGFDGPAARLFDEASRLMPKSFTDKVNTDELNRASKALSQGDFKEAADRFTIAFAAFQGAE